MEIETGANKFLENETSSAVYFTSNNSSNDNARQESIRIIQSSVASVGIIANLTVIVVFLNHKKLRRKIPNIFIINQVRKILYVILFFITIRNCEETDTIIMQCMQRDGK